MAGKTEGALRIAIRDFIETYVVETFEGWVTKILEATERAIRRVYSKSINRALDDFDLPPEALEMLEQILNPSEQAGASSLLGFGTQMGMGAASSMLAPLFRYLNYGMDRVLKSARVDPGTAITMAWRMPQYQEELHDDMNDLGWPDHMQDVWKEIVKPRLAVPDLVSLFLRKYLSKDELVDELTARGWETERINELLELSQVIPNVGDLIRMAVREAFRDDIAERFDYDADFPDQVVEWAEKQGLSREWVKYYWRAHWELPSVQAAYTMLHRLRPGTTQNPFTADDLRTLLRTADIPVFFRDRLMEVSYSPYTRVDVRRMFKVGVLNEEEVYQSYLDLGYDEEKAANLAEFAILDAATDERELTRTLITAGYERGTITRGEALSILQDIGYSLDRAEFIMAIEDADIAKKKVDEELDRVAFLYKEGEIDEPQVYAELGSLNLPAEQVANYIGKWDLEKRKKRSLPTKGELEDWYKRDVISREELIEGFEKRRYVVEDVDRYLLQLDQVIAEEASKEAERLQKEQERLLVAEQKSVYQERKNELDLEIAKANLAIADLKLSLHSVEDAEQIAQIKEQADAIRVYIAEIRVIKADVKLEFM